MENEDFSNLRITCHFIATLSTGIFGDLHTRVQFDIYLFDYSRIAIFIFRI